MLGWIKRRLARPPTGPVAISPEAARKLRRLKERRPPTQAENDCVAALSWQLGVPPNWLFDYDAMCFRPPSERG